MKRIIYLFVISFLLLGCEDIGEYHYEVSNELEYSDVQIKIETHKYIEKDSFALQPFERERMFSSSSRITALSGYPRDVKFHNDSLTDIFRIKVYVNGELIDKNFTKREYWEFRNDNSENSTYLLRIKQEMID